MECGNSHVCCWTEYLDFWAEQLPNRQLRPKLQLPSSSCPGTRPMHQSSLRPQLSIVIAALILAVFIAACGGGGSSSDPTQAPGSSTSSTTGGTGTGGGSTGSGGSSGTGTGGGSTSGSGSGGSGSSPPVVMNLTTYHNDLGRTG